jgi:hypothetical protein
VNVAPAATFEAVLDSGQPGLTPGVEVNDNQGAVAVAYTPAAAEIAAGVYVANLTAPDTQGQYTLIWRDAPAGTVVGVDDLTVTGSAPADPVPPADVYGTVDELFRRLKIRTPTAEQTAAAERIMVASSTDVNLKMDRSTDLPAGELAIAVESTYQRAEERWNESEVPFGAIGLDNPSGPVFASRHSRALAQLTKLKQRFGVG